MTNRFLKYNTYFITIYVTKRNIRYSDLETILSISINALKNIIYHAYCAISLKSKNEKIRHPHLHILVKTRNRINYRIFLSSIARRIGIPFSCRISPVDSYAKVIEYIDKHEVTFIYRPKHTHLYGNSYGKENKFKNPEKMRMHTRGDMEDAGYCGREKTQNEGSNNSRIHNQRVEIGRVRDMSNETTNEVINVEEHENIYELYFIKDILIQKYGNIDPHNYVIRINLPPPLHKKFQQIATYLDVPATDLLRYLVYKFVQYVEKNNLFPEIYDELHLRRVILQKKRAPVREIRIVRLPGNEIEEAIINIAEKILRSKYRYRIIDDNGNIDQTVLLKK